MSRFPGETTPESEVHLHVETAGNFSEDLRVSTIEPSNAGDTQTQKKNCQR